MQYVWLAVLVLAVIAEALTAGLVSIWFVPSALIALVLAACGVPEYLQFIVFFGLSAILLVLSKTIWKKFLKGKDVSKTNADALIGQIGVITENVDNLSGVGEVKVSGQRWSARSADGSGIGVGEKVEILEIKGVKLICKIVK